MSRMPVLFFGHGSPMNTLEQNRFTLAWRELGLRLPRPRALLAVSAHWYIGAAAVTAMPNPRTIHDFFGFPPELFAFQYPATGAPEIAQEIAETVKPEWISLDNGEWGLDHGTWSVLAHLYPDADIPVIQLSINALKPPEYHLDLATRLAPLRDRGVLILASGNIVHNLRRIDWTKPDEGYDWAHRFDNAVYDILTTRPADIVSVRHHPDYGMAVPTPDHFPPLLYLAGLASEPVSAIIRGYSFGSISMSSYAVGCTMNNGGEGAAAATLPREIPADNTNT